MRTLIAAAVQGLCAALCAVPPSTACAQESVLVPADAAAQALERRRSRCVDPADVFARRIPQDGPCVLPLYRLPAADDPTAIEPWRRPLSLPPLPERELGHALFWRFPVQPRGPYDAPRHSWR